MADAKITVEASLIIPLIISIICALLYETLLACDRGVINMSADRVLEETSASEAIAYEDENAENTVDISETIKNELSKKLMLYSIEELSFKRNRNHIVLSIRAVPEVSFGIAAMFSAAFGEYSISRSVNTGSICRDIRRIEIVKENP